MWHCGGVQWADGLGILRVQDEQCKPGFLVRVILPLYMSVLCACMFAISSIAFQWWSSEGFGRGNEGSPSPQTSFPCKRVFPDVCVHVCN